MPCELGGRMMNRGVIAALAAGIALIVVAGARVQAQAVAPYDGSGSAMRPEALDKPYDAAADALYQANRNKLFQKLADSAAKGDGDAMANLASVLEYGDPRHTQDRGAAFDLYEKAAAKDDRVGREKMCVAYLLGEDRPKDVAKGMTAYCNKLGTRSAVALWAIGYDYQYGLSGPKDEDTAMNLYAQAVQAGSGEAADALGQKALDTGKLEIARRWFRQGVYRGSTDAMDDLARLADAGQGGPQDKAEAYWLYVNAARRGNANARGWLAALPAPIEPLPRMALVKGGKATEITQTYKDKSGADKTLALNSVGLAQRLQDYYPSRAYEDHVEGWATTHCYIGADHKVDVCLIERESPMGYDFGRVLEGLYDGQLTVPDQDVAGQSTAHTVFVLTLYWLLQ